MKETSVPQYQAFLRDRELHPVQTQYESGRKIFSASPAFPLLNADVDANKHKSMTTSQFKSTRQEYAEWSVDEIRHRILQRVRYIKFCNHLKAKRAALMSRKAKKVNSKSKKWKTDAI